MNPDSLPPAVIAGADQELAADTEVLDELIDAWRAIQPACDRMGFDHLARVAAFSVGHVAFTPHAWVVLAIAVARLAGER